MKKKLYDTIRKLGVNKDYETLRRGAKIAAIAGCVYDNSFVKKNTKREKHISWYVRN